MVIWTGELGIGAEFRFSNESGSYLGFVEDSPIEGISVNWAEAEPPCVEEAEDEVKTAYKLCVLDPMLNNAKFVERIRQVLMARLDDAIEALQEKADDGSITIEDFTAEYIRQKLLRGGVEDRQALAESQAYILCVKDIALALGHADIAKLTEPYIYEEENR